MGFVVTPPEVKVRVRYYRGSMLWSFGVREVIWIAAILIIIFSPHLLFHHVDFEFYMYGLGGFSALAIVVLLWTWSSKWVATLRPSGIEYRSSLAASFGWGGWKKASWTQVESIRSTKTYERDGVVSTWGIQMDIHDPESPSGLYSLRISAGEFFFLDYLEAMVRWTDPAKVDSDLRRILEGGNRGKLDSARKFGRGWGLVWGLILGMILVATRDYPSSERWMIYGIFLAVAMVAGLMARFIRKS